MSLHVVPFSAAHLDAGARLLAARHAGDRARTALLPASFEDPAACRAVLESVLGYSQGVAAFDEERLVGFAFVVLNLRAADTASARYGPPRSAMVLAHGHAVAEDVDREVVYPALFAPIAERAIRRGVFDHVAHVPAGDQALTDAWANLGFGRVNAVAVRDLRALERSAPTGVEVTRAGPADLERVDALVDEESRFHATAPIFRPYVRGDAAEAVRAGLATSLQDEEYALLIARQGGRDVGITTVEPSRGSPLFTPERAVYIGDTAVVPDARRSGVGVALVSAALEWARERGHMAATLHFATANPVSAPFWTGLGFEPVMWHLQRHVDERIAWAQPPTGQPSVGGRGDG